MGVTINLKRRELSCIVDELELLVAASEERSVERQQAVSDIKVVLPRLHRALAPKKSKKSLVAAAQLAFYALQGLMGEEQPNGNTDSELQKQANEALIALQETLVKKKVKVSV